MKQTHQEMIAIEFENAKRKHPKFCDRFHETNLETIKESLSVFREIGTDNASLILREEVAEAIEAYLEGRLQHCLVELAQCGAVVLRMMEFVQEEIDEKKGGEPTSQYRCTVCGRVGSVGRCCGLETREPVEGGAN